jgi:hypothetical protein
LITRELPLVSTSWSPFLLRSPLVYEPAPPLQADLLALPFNWPPSEGTASLKPSDPVLRVLMSRFRSGCLRCLEIVRPDTATALAAESVPLVWTWNWRRRAGKADCNCADSRLDSAHKPRSTHCAQAAGNCSSSGSRTWFPRTSAMAESMRRTAAGSRLARKWNGTKLVPELWAEACSLCQSWRDHGHAVERF